MPGVPTSRPLGERVSDAAMLQLPAVGAHRGAVHGAASATDVLQLWTAGSHLAGVPEAKPDARCTDGVATRSKSSECTEVGACAAGTTGRGRPLGALDGSDRAAVGATEVSVRWAAGGGCSGR